MIPLYDTIPSKRFPVANWLLIGGNALVFMFQLTLGETEMREIFYQVGLVPARYTNPEWALEKGLSASNYWPFVTNMFLHGGWMHFIVNMWTLWIFGDNVEDRMGRLRYIVFYFLCGIGASYLHFLLNLDSTVPALGASGAISGVMGAYMLLYPHSRIVLLLPLFFLPFFVEVSAFLYIAVWFLGQLISGTASAATQSGGVAFWAHIGGFIAGILTFWMFIQKKRKPQR